MQSNSLKYLLLLCNFADVLSSDFFNRVRETAGTNHAVHIYKKATNQCLKVQRLINLTVRVYLLPVHTSSFYF